MAKVYTALLFLFGTLLVLTTVQSKTIVNEHGQVINGDTEGDQETQMDELSNDNRDSFKGKRAYKPPPAYYEPRRTCGNGLYAPRSEVCCCGKTYKIKSTRYGYKRVQWKCCGYQYIDGLYNQCCPYFTVISKKHKCPRSKL